VWGSGRAAPGVSSRAGLSEWHGAAVVARQVATYAWRVCGENRGGPRLGEREEDEHGPAWGENNAPDPR
jgi:hypothetical protein